jgi:hypothetical protein
MNAVIFGATGMVGSEVLRFCLASDRINSILSVGRKTTGIVDPKLSEIEHSDFPDFSSIASELSRMDICFYCLGVYQTQVSADVFWRITVDYLQALVRTAEMVRKDAIFCLFSAQGADPSEKSPIRFAKAKGRAEKLLVDSDIHQSYIFRPGYIQPGALAAQTGWSERLFRQACRVFPQIGIDAPDLAKVMVYVGLNGCASSVLSNREIRKLTALIGEERRT